MLALLLAPAALAPVAQSQIISIYGTVSPAHLTNVAAGVVTTSAGYQEEYANYWASSYGGGVTFGALSLGPLRVGFDARGGTKPGSNGADLVLGGLKVGIKLPVIALKPYIQGSVGYLGTRTPNNTTGAASGSVLSNNYLAYEVLGGVDFPVIHFLDFRLIEIGGGQGIYIGTTGGVSNATIFTLSTGVVFHF
jgi:hypothetical protein